MDSIARMLTWSPEFETGNDAVDFQHKYFLDLIRRIHQNLLHVDNPEYQHNLLLELVKYAEFHFLSEENIASAENLPGLDIHKERHQELIRELQKRLDEGKKSTDEYESLIIFVIEWFFGHTYLEDQQLFKGLASA